MSSEIAIKVENISKCYQIYDHPRDRLKQFVMPRVRRASSLQPKQYFREFWALRDVSFEVNKGETVGIIGRNGSGKSTLLQMICGTLTPSSGSIQTHGRIAALLELGSGFNPDFTGRENVYMNAAVLGLSTDEIDFLFDDIAGFADIGEFIEQPIKTYSTGMYVRLAFAVAISIEPDILIVDEALAVGDEPFQRKCYSRIERIRDSGATILLVTHAATTITQMCSRALLLDHGRRLYMGNPKLAVENYCRLIYSEDAEVANIKRSLQIMDGNPNYFAHKEEVEHDELGAITPSTDNSEEMDNKMSSEGGLLERFDRGLKPLSTMVYESLGATIREIRIENRVGQKVNVLAPGDVYWYCYEVDFSSAAANVQFGMVIKTTPGHELGAIGSHPFGQSIIAISAGTRYGVRFPFQNIFSPGTYFMNAGCIGFVNGKETFLHRIIDAFAFRVEYTKSEFRYAGYVQISAGMPTFQSLVA